MPDLYSLLKQFNAIGGMAQTGQSGFCLLMALWQKANELNWTDRFTMTNAELLYKAGFNCKKTLIEVRNKLSQLGYFKYIKPDNRRHCGVYVLNYNLLPLANYLPAVNSNVNNTHYLPDVTSEVTSEVTSGVTSDVTSGVTSGVNINKPTIPTKPSVRKEEKEKQKQKEKEESLAALSPNGDGFVSKNQPGNRSIHEDVAKVMDFYNKTFAGLWQKPLRLTPDREEKIKARLKKFTVEEICAAIKNIRTSPFHCGENDVRRVYATPEFICRNDGQIDKWLKMKKRDPLDWMERV